MLPLASIFIALILASTGSTEAETASPDSVSAAHAVAAPPSAPVPWPSDIQIGAPSINSASPDLLDHCGFPALAGLALDERLEKGPDDRAITVNLTPLALARLVGRDEATGPRPESDRLERVAARVTIGGPPQKIPRRNPGRAGRPSNHVTSELKLVLLRDRPPACAATQLALALAADNLATGYGLDRYGATLIAEHGGPWRWTANAGYNIVERYHAPHRIEETKLATGVAWRLFGIAERPVELALSAGCLLRTRSGADWQDGAQVNVPITSALELSAAIRRSERPELPGQDTMREVVSLACALGGAPR